MRVTIHKTDLLRGVIRAPSSKSEAVRALIFGLLALGTSHIHQILDSEDVRDAIEAIRALGARVSQQGSSLTIYSEGLSQINGPIHTGNSGITTRFIMPLLGLRSNLETPVVLDCGDQMRARPMGPLIKALQNLGMQSDSEYLPVKLNGSLKRRSD